MLKTFLLYPNRVTTYLFATILLVPGIPAALHELHLMPDYNHFGAYWRIWVFAAITSLMMRATQEYDRLPDNLERIED